MLWNINVSSFFLKIKFRMTRIYIHESYLWFQHPIAMLTTPLCEQARTHLQSQKKITLHSCHPHNSNTTAYEKFVYSTTSYQIIHFIISTTVTTSYPTALSILLYSIHWPLGDMEKINVIFQVNFLIDILNRPYNTVFRRMQQNSFDDKS